MDEKVKKLIENITKKHREELERIEKLPAGEQRENLQKELDAKMQKELQEEINKDLGKEEEEKLEKEKERKRKIRVRRTTRARRTYKNGTGLGKSKSSRINQRRYIEHL